mmetsp:Transcript_93792/g.205276  ORF Transcript_93792/g.205276 Transcript_93792/m.205276 type:complete len:404 (-) Transcript_93792:766-1977(-)
MAASPPMPTPMSIAGSAATPAALPTRKAASASSSGPPEDGHMSHMGITSFGGATGSRSPPALPRGSDGKCSGYVSPTPICTSPASSSAGPPPLLPMGPPPMACRFEGRDCPPTTARNKPRSGEASEVPSESSANMEDKDTEEDDFQSTIPNLERFYEQMAAKARLPTWQGPGNAANSNWVLSLARSYRRLSKDKRSRGRLRALLRPNSEGGLAETAESSNDLPLSGCPNRSARPEQPGWSSNTDDSGYEAGYETDADESELSEWEGCPARHSHKRKLDALVQLTMRLNVVSGQTSDESMQDLHENTAPYPPSKTPRALGTHPVGMRYSLSSPNHTDLGIGGSCSIAPFGPSARADPTTAPAPFPSSATSSSSQVWHPSSGPNVSSGPSGWPGQAQASRPMELG